MKNSRLAALMTVAVVVTSLFVMGCGQSPTGLILDDGPSTRPGHTGVDPDSNLGNKNNDHLE